MKPVSRARRALGSAFQTVSRDPLRDLNHQAERLGSAADESAAHLGTDMRGLDQRLSRIEDEVAALRKALSPPSA